MDPITTQILNLADEIKSLALTLDQKLPPPVVATPDAMPIGDLPGWHQIFADDFLTDVPLGSFPGMVYGPKWNAYPEPWRDTSKNGLYSPAKVLSVSASALDMYLHTEAGVHLVAAPVPRLPGTTGMKGQTYGRYSVRFKIDPVPGYKTAWLLWPDSNVWPRDGEIDFPEGNLDGKISAFMHYANPAGGRSAFSTSVPEAGAWHIATTEWTAGKVVFILDGATVGTATTQVPAVPMHWVLQTETQLSGGPPSDAAAGHVQIDWVVAYSPA